MNILWIHNKLRKVYFYIMIDLSISKDIILSIVSMDLHRPLNQRLYSYKKCVKIKNRSHEKYRNK